MLYLQNVGFHTGPAVDIQETQVIDSDIYTLQENIRYYIVDITLLMSQSI